MEEAIYFSHQGVSVTKSNFIVQGKAMPIHSVTSVERRVLKPRLELACACIFGGLVWMLGVGHMHGFAIVLMMLGGVLWYLAKPRYALIIHTHNKEIKALVSEKSLDVENVLTALNVAIALKGDMRS